MLVPMTGDDKKIGQQIIKATRMALKDIDSDIIEIFPKDTGSTCICSKICKRVSVNGPNIVIGPVFYKSLTYLDELKILHSCLWQQNNWYSKNIISRV